MTTMTRTTKAIDFRAAIAILLFLLALLLSMPNLLIMMVLMLIMSALMEGIRAMSSKVQTKPQARN